MTKVRNGPELRLDRIGPRRVRRREAQLDVLPPGPAADRRGLVRRQVVHDHEQPVPAGPGGPDRLQRGQGVVGALVLAGHAPQLVIADAVAAVEVADAVRAVVSRAQPDRAVCAAPSRRRGTGGWTAARTGRRRSTGPGNALVTYSIRSSLASRSGSVDSFQVRVRWKEMPRSCRICRSRSRPIRTGRPDGRLNSRPACAGSTG